MSPRVLVIGAGGMLGHRVWQECRQRFDTWATLRAPSPVTALYDDRRVLLGVDAGRSQTVEDALARARPEVVINCAGVVKQLAAGRDPVTAITINALFPHQLAKLCDACDARLVHMSTDCVFSGRKGAYTESDPPDPDDLYGRTKLLGEVADDGALTIRTSMIGRELHGQAGLLEWLIGQRGGRVQGFRRALFSGVTTIALSRLLVAVVSLPRELSGLYHIASDAITKYDLLCRLNERIGLGIHVTPSDAVRIDRSLNGDRFREATGIVVPTWDRMIDELAEDRTPYDEWRRRTVVC